MSTISAPSSFARSAAPAERARGRNRARCGARRSAKIVATLGPASSTPERLRALFDAGVDVFRLNFSHGTHDEHRALFADDPPASRARPGGRSAFSPICRARNCGSAISPTAGSSSAPARVSPRPRPTARAMQTRAPLPHPEIFAALEPGHRAARSMTARCGSGSPIAAPISPRPRCLVGGTCPTTRASTCRQCVLPISAVTEKDRADLVLRAGARRRLDRAVVRAAPRGCRRGPQADRQRRRAHGQARKAVGDPPARRDHRARRRADGGARRSRRRDAARGRAERAEADHPRLPASPASR